MSVFLVALAAWLVVRAGERQDATGWMLAAGVALALANATAYSSALFDPIVILLALVTAFPKPGGKLAAGRALALVAVVALLLTPGLLIGGSSYLHGIERDDAGPGRRHRLHAVRPRQFLVLDRPLSSWPLSAAWSSAGSASRDARRRGCWRCWPPPRCSCRSSRRACTPPHR